MTSVLHFLTFGDAPITCGLSREFSGLALSRSFSCDSACEESFGSRVPRCLFFRPLEIFPMIPRFPSNAPLCGPPPNLLPFYTPKVFLPPARMSFPLSSGKVFSEITSGTIKPPSFPFLFLQLLRELSLVSLLNRSLNPRSWGFFFPSLLPMSFLFLVPIKTPFVIFSSYLSCFPSGMASARLPCLAFPSSTRCILLRVFFLPSLLGLSCLSKDYHSLPSARLYEDSQPPFLKLFSFFPPPFPSRYLGSTILSPLKLPFFRGSLRNPFPQGVKMR